MQMNLNLTFLGTGTSQGIPVIGSEHPVCLSTNTKDKRLRSSLLIESEEGTALVIDCGPDFRQQMLRNPIKQLDAILLTHDHADHTMGIDDIRPFVFKQGGIDFFSSKETLSALKNRFDYIFNPNYQYPGIPKINSHLIGKDHIFNINELKITSILASHGKSNVYGFKIGGLVYLTDVKSIEKDQLAYLINCDVLIINALRKEIHHSHLTLDEAINLSKQVNAKQTYFTHISHHLGFHDEVEKNLEPNFNLAYDQLQFTYTY
ncbi:MAG: MBL fold metallo-hydrolase [Flavobacteriaceae bacterium]|nr:MBL fold metallo-hydrolase [Flavobacteriaceae bacterium]